MEKVKTEDEAKMIAAACDKKQAVVSSVTRETKTVNPPKLYDLTTLQREANRYYGFTAQQTLELVQSLYEKKLLTYPRTDSQFITDDMEGTVRQVIGIVCQKIALFHAVDPDEKPSPEEKKDRHTKEVEAESVAYTVCQRYGLETSDYSFGYIAGWSSDKETKELKGSLETIRKTAAEMIESIDAQLKVLLAEKEQSEVRDKDASPATLRDEGVPIYRETANYAYEAGELDAYRASHKANLDCREAIEQAISDNYADNRLSSEDAVKSVLGQFSEKRVEYVLANTIQHKDWDGRISRKNIEWAANIEVCPEKSTQFIVDKAHPGLTDLFVKEFIRQMDVMRQEQTARDPEVVAWEKDEITSYKLTVHVMFSVCMLITLRDLCLMQRTLRITLRRVAFSVWQRQIGKLSSSGIIP